MIKRNGLLTILIILSCLVPEAVFTSWSSSGFLEMSVRYVDSLENPLHRRGRGLQSARVGPVKGKLSRIEPTPSAEADSPPSEGIHRTIAFSSSCLARGAGMGSSSEIPRGPGIQISVPKRATAAPVPIRITMIADMETYYSNRGNLDKVLNVIMVRRDAPGLRFVAKVDPHAMMQPDSPMPPPPPGTDIAHGGLIKEERVLDVLGYGARHEGNAEYYVLASFARWFTDPQPLVFEGYSKRLPAGDANSLPSLGAELRKAIPAPPVQSGIAARFKKRPLPSVEGGIREIGRASCRERV
jgi:hypothetical protein